MLSLSGKGVLLVGIKRIGQGVAHRQAQEGVNILFSDWAALQTPYRDYLPYLKVKASIAFMTRAFAAGLASSGILVNALAPGPTMRPRTDISETVWQRGVVEQAPLRREFSADEIPGVVVTLLKSETITGETIRVDSGRHLAGPGTEG